MKKVVYGTIRYYEDEATTDFLITKINRKVTVDGNYRYLNENLFYKIFSFILYYCIAIPVLLLITWIKGIKVYGRKNIRGLKTGYVMYINHTNPIDAFLAQVRYARPRRGYIIANKDAVSIKGIGWLVKALGTFPLPDTKMGLVNLTKAVGTILSDRKVLIVYPEAHVWDYYTGLRPFPLTSFKFAVNNHVPAVPVAVTYRKPTGLFKEYRRPRMHVFVGKPIYEDLNFTTPENIQRMHDMSVEFITKNLGNPKNVALYKYVKKEK